MFDDIAFSIGDCVRLHGAEHWTGDWANIFGLLDDIAVVATYDGYLEVPLSAVEFISHAVPFTGDGSGDASGDGSGAAGAAADGSCNSSLKSTPDFTMIYALPPMFHALPLRKPLTPERCASILRRAAITRPMPLRKPLTPASVSSIFEEIEKGSGGDEAATKPSLSMNLGEGALQSGKGSCSAAWSVA